MGGTLVTLPDIRPLVQQIADRFHPRKVILFGSYAYGEPHKESDLDLLVIVPDPPQRQEAQGITSELGKGYPVPLQIVFMSPEEFEKTREVGAGWPIQSIIGGKSCTKRTREQVVWDFAQPGDRSLGVPRAKKDIQAAR